MKAKPPPAQGREGKKGPLWTIAGNQAEQGLTREVQFAGCDTDLRGTGSSNEVFQATRESGHKHGMAEFTTSLKTTPSTRAARGGEGSEWC